MALTGIGAEAQATEKDPEKAAEKAEKAPEKAAPEASEAEKKEKIRGPAEDLAIEAGIGYGIGAHSAIAGHNQPTVVYGPMFHIALGYAWTIRANQSLGVQAFADGMVDSDRTTGAGTKVAGRYGAAAFMVGEKAHLRLGFGYVSGVHLNDRPDALDGLGIAFTAGFHFMMGKQGGWKRAAITWDVAPAWDFLGVGSETLHRWSFGMLLGVAVY